jgi:hypothetical protein
LGYQSDNLDPFTRHLAADELRVPYGAADADETFLLDFASSDGRRNTCVKFTRRSLKA